MVEGCSSAHCQRYTDVSKTFSLPGEPPAADTFLLPEVEDKCSFLCPFFFFECTTHMCRVAELTLNRDVLVCAYLATVVNLLSENLFNSTQSDRKLSGCVAADCPRYVTHCRLIA